MHRSCPPSPKRPSSRANDESSVEDYEEAYLDVDDVDMEYNIDDPAESSVHGINIESRPSSVTTADWEEPESWITSMANSESLPVSTPCSSSGASPIAETSSQGVSPGLKNNLEQAFPFNIPEDADQSLSSISDVLQVEKDFMEYVMSFPLNVSSVPPQLLPASAAGAKKPQNDSNPKIGLDHLDNLCKLMEQLSDLKEANIKLKRRVQYLEDIKTLHEIHKEMAGERRLYSSGLSEDEVQQLKSKRDESQEDEHSAESQPESNHEEIESEDRLQGLYRSKTANQIPSTTEYKVERGHKSRSATISKERRERSKSVGHPSHSKSNKPKKRPSRWSKVKEVLGIEKADEFSTAGESEVSKDERCKAEMEREQGLQTRKESEQSSKVHKLSSSRSHTSVLSSRSFSEAERQTKNLTPVKKSGTLDSKTSQAEFERFEKEEMAKKSPKSPWGKMKTMIQIRKDNRQQKSESSSSSPRDAKPSKPTNGNQEQANGHSSSRRTQRTNHRLVYQDGSNVASPTDFDSHIQNNQNSDRSPRHQRINTGESVQYRQKSSQKYNLRKSSAPNLDLESKLKIEKCSNGSQKSRYEDMDSYYSIRDPSAPKENKRKKSKHRPPPLDYVEDQQLPIEDEDKEVPKSPGCSPLAQRKWMWTKVKDVLKGKREDEGPTSFSVPSSPGSVTEGMTFDFNLDKSKEEESLNSEYQTPRMSDVGQSNAMILPNSSPSTTVTELLRELQQNLSDDFNKKLEEWQRCRAEGIHKCPNPEVERKDSFGRMRKVSKPEKKISTGEKLSKSNYHIQKKDLSWLEKEQQKVEREIIRLTKEKQKFEKRAFRLKQLKEAMTDGDGQKKEVLVKTSAGEFRFEGISDAFTKKLYEWETKKGVNPELSTIALLDESLKPPVDTVVTSTCSNSVGTNSARPSPEPSKNCYQVSRASSEPDLSSTQKETPSNNQATRSKSGDTLLAGEKDIVGSLEILNSTDVQQESRDVMHHNEDNYYSLLEENMYLLDQLKEKEEICNHLQNELDRLDDKTEKTNRTHQEEMEKYRQKLWEIHMSRPRDLQGSLHLISELKSRIEELQKCSDKLKMDRERLEESFQFHSNQQARLADDLIRKVRDFQETGPLNFNRGCRRKWRRVIKCDPSSISRIHDLSTKLLQQARDVEQSLMERTRQVCHLRWELLHRDMSAVLLQAALHRVTSQGEPVTILPTWDKRRNTFKNIKAWSVDTTTRRPSEDLVTDDWLQERLRQLSMTPYNDWANIDFSPNDLMATAHELKKETLRLSISRPDRVSDSEEKKSATWSAESEMADSDRYYDTGSAANSRSSSFSSGPGGLRGSHSDTRLYERSRALRRNSSSSMSCVEASDSSSLHDSDKAHFLVKKFPWRTQWRSLDNVSSSCSSRSSVLDEDLNKSHWRHIRSSNREEVLQPQEELSVNQLQQRYGSFREVDEEGEEPRVESSVDWSSQCLITPKPIHLAAISDTESERNTYSPHPLSGSRNWNNASQMKHSKNVSSYPARGKTKGKLQYFSERAPDLTTQCGKLTETNPKFSDGNTSEYIKPYISATEGSLESLDKYETAIRDEDLTFSDEQNERQYYDCTKHLETFSEFEEDLKQRSSKQIQSSSHSSPHDCISDNIDKNKETAHPSTSTSEYNNRSTPGSPDISKYKYKGTKGFGRTNRLGYSKKEDEERLDYKSLRNLNNNNARNITPQVEL